MIDGQLDLATRAYFESETKTNRGAMRVTLPRLLKYYRGDFGTDRESILFAAKHVAEGDAAWLRENADRVDVDYGDYDWSIVH
jgi:hypothetical protein